MHVQSETHVRFVKATVGKSHTFYLDIIVKLLRKLFFQAYQLRGRTLISWISGQRPTGHRVFSQHSAWCPLIKAIVVSTRKNGIYKSSGTM